MMKPVSAAAAEESAAEIVAREEHIAPAPRVSVQAFCETVETAAAIQAAGEDRRLSKAHLRIQMGGLTAAIEAYQSSPTPNVIILETESRSEDILGGLDQLAEVNDAGTRWRLGLDRGALRLEQGRCAAEVHPRRAGQIGPGDCHDGAARSRTVRWRNRGYSGDQGVDIAERVGRAGRASAA